MEHREIRQLLEDEIMDEQKKIDFLTIEQELNEYFKSQSSEDFRHQLKQFLLKEAGVTRRAKIRGLKDSFYRFWPVATAAAVAVIMVLSFVNSQVWKKHWPSFQSPDNGAILVSLKDDAVLPESQEVKSQDVKGQDVSKSSIVENNINSESNTDSKTNSNAQEIAVESSMKRALSQPDQLDNQEKVITPENYTDDSAASRNKEDVFAESLSMSPSGESGALGASGGSATRAGINRNEQTEILSHGIDYRQDKVRVYRDKNVFIETTEAWNLAQRFGLLKEGLLYENDLEYRFVQDDQTLTLSYNKMPIKIHYQKKGPSDKHPRQLNKDQAVQKAREALTTLPCFKIVPDLVSPITLVEDDYVITFWQQIDGLRLLSDGVRVRVDGESGTIIEIKGPIHQFETVAEYPLLTIDQAVTGLFENRKDIDIQQVELIQSLQFNGPNDILAVPGYYITGHYPDGRPYETTVPAIKLQ